MAFISKTDGAKVTWRDSGEILKLFLKSWVVKIGIVGFLCFALYYHLFLYWDVLNGCYVQIRFPISDFNSTTIKKGILFLKENVPGEYKRFCENVSVIDPNTSCGGFGGGCFRHFSSQDGVIDVSVPYGYVEASAKVLIHETCHVIQFNEGRAGDENECYGRDSILEYRK